MYTATTLTAAHIRKWGKEFEFNLVPLGIHHIAWILKDYRGSWVGYSTYDPQSKILTTLEVNRKYRGQGFGKILLDLWPRAERLYVEAQNIPAIALYKKEGWRDIGDHPAVDPNGIKPARGGHWIHMVKCDPLLG